MGFFQLFTFINITQKAIGGSHLRGNKSLGFVDVPQTVSALCGTALPLILQTFSAPQTLSALY